MKYLYLLFSILITTSIQAQVNYNYGPEDFITIGEGLAGFTGELSNGGRFGRDHDVIGDVNGDGVLDLIIGARSDDDGATDAGAAYILFMNEEGTVDSHQKISMTQGGFDETLNAGNFFGYGVAGIGDYDGDNVPDIAISAPVSPNNSLYIIHLNSDGTVKDYVKNENVVAQGLSAVGDLNNDGRIDLVACMPKANAGGVERGAINLLFLNEASEVINSNTVTISSTQGGFGIGIEDGDKFGGREAALLGDLDGDGNPELAVGAFMSDGGKGAIWILSLDADSHTVLSKQKITEGSGGFDDELTTGANPNGTEGANFGHALCAAGDLNGDGIPDLITGANQQNEGEAYILYLNADKTVKSYVKIHNNTGGFGLDLEAEERFSRSISFIGDLRNDGSIAVNFGGGAGSTGLVYILFFNPCSFYANTINYEWSVDNILYSNWNIESNNLEGQAQTIEECSYKSLELDAAYFTFEADQGKCICYSNEAQLSVSEEEHTLYLNECVNINSTSQTLEFNEGWSMFSTFITQSNMNTEVVFEEIIDQIIIIKDFLGAAYLPEWGFDGIGEIQNDQGYLIKTYSNCITTLTGSYNYPELNPIPIHEGWSQIPYLRVESADVTDVFEDQIENIFIVKDELGLAYLPNWGFNGIGDLLSGKAYQVKSDEASFLFYHSNLQEY